MGGSTWISVLSDFVAGYGQRATVAGWPFGPLAQWIGFGAWSPGGLMWVLVLLFIPAGRLPGPRAYGATAIAHLPPSRLIPPPRHRA